jgi:membrane-associated phospholipid phosphatase
MRKQTKLYMRLFRNRGWRPQNVSFSGGQLVIALDLVAACAIVQLLLDRWLAIFLSEFYGTTAILVLRLLPDRTQLSLLATFCMALLIAYRIASGDRFGPDRGMFVLGCGVVSGFVADKLKLLFGRSPPDALMTDGAYGFHFFEGGDGFDSFPSCHAAMAAAVAAAASALWPAHRRLFMGLAVGVAASRCLIGARYVSDALLGFAVGLAVVVLMQIAFHRCGIELESRKEKP